MIVIDSSELTTDEELALAGALSDALGGRAVALVKNGDVVLDVVSGPSPTQFEVEAVIKDFLSKRPNGGLYSLEEEGERFRVRSPDPLAAKSRRRPSGLPENLKKCPFCSFVTPYDELYTVHVRSHGFT